MHRSKLRFLLAALTAAIPLVAQVQITYLANEGVMIRAGKSKVLIDALIRDSLGDYLRHSAANQARIETGKPPFEGAAIALATHYHLDHWDPGAVARFLLNNPNALFASTPQGVGPMPSAVRKQVRELWPPVVNPSRIETGGVLVEALDLDHGGPAQNLAYFVTIGGRNLAHLGDSNPSATNFEKLLSRKAPDVAMIPFWWLLDQSAADFVLNRWKPSHIVAFHLGAQDILKSAAKVQERAPAAWVCTKQGESRTF